MNPAAMKVQTRGLRKLEREEATRWICTVTSCAAWAHWTMVVAGDCGDLCLVGHLPLCLEHAKALGAQS